MSAAFKNYLEWEKQVPRSIRGDNLWKLTLYRSALFISDLAEIDSETLEADPRFASTAGQLVESATVLGDHIAEGYSLPPGKDQIASYESALGAARQARALYLQVRPILGQSVADHRSELLANLIKETIAQMKSRHEKSAREQGLDYLRARDSHAEEIPFASLD
ncbi:MAG: hypothetical protein EPO32_05225 [Anaerolineae bacterium]|nr:MAG: hypothetical protein EPO32_05225 [Anaerolineae bacterium]